MGALRNLECELRSTQFLSKPNFYLFFLFLLHEFKKKKIQDLNDKLINNFDIICASAWHHHPTSCRTSPRELLLKYINNAKF